MGQRAVPDRDALRGIPGSIPSCSVTCTCSTAKSISAAIATSSPVVTSISPILFRLDPVISLEAATTIRQYEVTVNFSGPASHLTMSYRSDPPLPSSDIIALLALGQTGEESRLRGLPAVQTPGTGATTLLSEPSLRSLAGAFSASLA